MPNSKFDIPFGSVTPNLFFGLGGAGQRVIGRIAKHLEGKYQNEDHKKLTRFIVVDTDAEQARALKHGRGKNGPVDESIVISDFDKQAYAAMKRGEKFSLEDPYLTQWIYPDYHFRGGETAGAGQIRIESRLGLYNTIENHDLYGVILNHFRALKDHKLTASAEGMKAHIVFSLAGGTGSGTFLQFAYFLKSIAKEIAPDLTIYGYALQPHVFQEVVGGNFSGVCANSYAALKELEHMNRLDAAAEVSGGIREVEFHYDVPGRIEDNGMVKGRPFALTYILDVPSDFATADLSDAIADTIFFQVYSPFGAHKHSDVDNFAKHTRALYPTDLQEQTGEGYTNHYGTFGMCVLQVPDDDVLRYCGLRFAADAVRKYLLLSDPSLLPGDDAEIQARFRQQQAHISDQALNGLTPEDKHRRYDEAFARKLELLEDLSKKREGSIWSLATVLGEIDGRFQTGLEELTGRIVASASATLPRLSQEALGSSYSWSPDSALNNLKSKQESAKRAVEQDLQSALEDVVHGFWTTFLGGTDDGTTKSLNPYQQRYALLALRGRTRMFDRETAPLSTTSVDQAVDSYASSSSGLKTWEHDLRQRLTASVDTLRSQKPSGFLGNLLGKEERERTAEETREQIVKTYNRSVDDISRGMRAHVQAELVKGLVGSAEKILRTFREIDQGGDRAAVELENRATDYLEHGALEGYVSEANQYAIDEEALLGSDGKRLWDWYYLDQVAPRLKGQQETAVQEALSRELQPKYDEQGAIIKRSADDVINDIVSGIRKATEDALSKQITGGDGRGGLMIDDAILLEGLYVYLRRTQPGSEPRLALAPFQSGGSVNPQSLWEHPKIGNSMTVYAKQKLERAVMAKAHIFADFDTTNFDARAHATEKRVIGAIDHYRSGLFGDALKDASGSQTEFLSGLHPWHDPKRIVIYHYLIGVPLYSFSRITGELQRAYRKHQSNDNKAWYLHVDKNFENLPDLDPMDIKRERLIARLLPAFASGHLDISPSTGQIRRKSERAEGSMVDFARDPMDAVDKISPHMAAGSSVSDADFKPLLESWEHMANATRRRRLDGKTRARLASYEERLHKTVSDLRHHTEGSHATGTEARQIRCMDDLLQLTRLVLAYSDEPTARR